MSSLTATSKGVTTRATILDHAYGIACASGLEGLSIAPLAAAVGMSKSGVFAHFGSRQGLQLAVLDDAAERFGNAVLIPALSLPRGQPRLRAIMRNWFEWVRNTTGGCVLLGAATEYDDRRGPLRDRVLHNDRRWRTELRRTIEQAVDAMDLVGEILGECIAADMPRKRAVQAATPLNCAIQAMSHMQGRRAS